MADPRLETALRDLEVTANNFAIRLVRMAEVRSSYVQKIQEMSQSIRQAVDAKTLSVENGAKIANEMRNQIMEMQRLRDFDLGRALARQLKSKGLSLEESIAHSMNKLKVQGRPFPELSGQQQRMVLEDVIESSGRSRGAVRPVDKMDRMGHCPLIRKTDLAGALPLGFGSAAVTAGGVSLYLGSRGGVSPEPSSQRPLSNAWNGRF